MKCPLRLRVDRMPCKFVVRKLFSGGKRELNFSDLLRPRFKSEHSFMRASSPVHVRQVCLCVMYLVVCQIVSVSIYLCLCLHACLCFAHSCLINIPSEAHLVCFEEARGAAAAGALKQGWASSGSSPLTHKSTVQGPLPVTV